MAGPASSPIPGSKAPTARSIRTCRRTRTACSGCSSSSAFPAASQAMSRRRRPARSTRAANSAMRCRMPMARPSTTPISSSPASSATARRRPDRWRPPGIPTNSSIPCTDGAVLPILHLNGYKIANPTILARIGDEELDSLFVGYGYKPHLVEGDDPAVMHQLMAATLDQRLRRDRGDPARRARRQTRDAPGRWPMIILKTPKGWTGPKEVDGLKTEGFWRSHQVPFAEMTKPGACEAARTMDEELPARRSCSMRPARSKPRSRRSRPQGERRMSANPACQWRAVDARARPARLSRLCGEGRDARRVAGRSDRGDGGVPARCAARQRGAAQFPHVRAGRDRVQPAIACLRGDRPRLGCGAPAL